MRASISKPTPFIYLAFEKTDPFIYLIIQNADLFIYCPLIFCTHLLLVVTQISQNIIEYYENKQLRKISERKICAYTRMSEKWGLSHRHPEKSGHSYTFCLKKGGLYIYIGVRVTDRHCRHLRRKIKFGTKNHKLAKTSGEKNIT